MLLSERQKVQKGGSSLPRSQNDEQKQWKTDRCLILWWDVYSYLTDDGESFYIKIMSTQFKKSLKQKQMKTWQSSNPILGELQNDHIASTSPKEIKHVWVQWRANVDSDHYLTRIKIKHIPNKNNKKTPKVEKYRIKELKINQEIIETHQRELDTLDFYIREKIAQII